MINFKNLSNILRNFMLVGKKKKSQNICINQDAGK